MLARVAWEEPVFGSLHSPPGTQDLQESGREHRVAIFLAFALLHLDDHALAVDGMRRKRDGLGETQPSGITGGQDGAMFCARDAVQEVTDLLWAQDDR